jgi:hypothetical protein
LAAVWEILSALLSDGMKPVIFISAVSGELKTSRQVAANTLYALGYDPDWQDVFETSGDELLPMLRRKIDGAAAVLQIVGDAYGFEPRTPTVEFGRVSYTQYEALYAKSRKKPIYYLIAQPGCPRDKPPEEIDAPRSETREAWSDAEERRQRQSAYREKICRSSHVYYLVASEQDIELQVRRIRNELGQLRRRFRQAVIAAALLLVFIAAAVVWLKIGQDRQSQQLLEQSQAAQRRRGEQREAERRQSDEISKAQEELRSVRAAFDTLAVQIGNNMRLTEDLPARLDRAYADLEAKFDLPPGVLKREMPQLAERLLAEPTTSLRDRSKALLIKGEYAAAERVALQDLDRERDELEQKRQLLIERYATAGWAAHGQIEYARAITHFQNALELVNRDQDPDQWAKLQASVRLVKALDDLTEIELVETPLADVIDFLRDAHNVPIMIDIEALDAVGLSPDFPVTFQARGITLDTALRRMLEELDLTYVIRDEKIVVTTPEEAGEPST